YQALRQEAERLSQLSFDIEPASQRHQLVRGPNRAFAIALVPQDVGHSLKGEGLLKVHAVLGGSIVSLAIVAHRLVRFAQLAAHVGNDIHGVNIEERPAQPLVDPKRYLQVLDSLTGCAAAAQRRSEVGQILRVTGRVVESLVYRDGASDAFDRLPIPLLVPV